METATGDNYTVSELLFKVYVYLYRDPKDGTPIYVGKGTGFRAWMHLGKSQNVRLSNLINKRKREGFEILPELLCLFEVEDNEKALKLEQELIAKYGRADKKQGTLFNGTDGGEGGLGQVTEEIEFRGTVYANRTELCRAYNQNEGTVRTRLKLEWSLAEALEVEHRDRAWEARPIECNGVRYPSISQFAQAIGSNEGTVRSQLDAGFSPDEIASGEVQRKGTQIICKGARHVSLKAFARAIGKSEKAVQYWYETGYTPEEIAEGKIRNKNAKYVNFRGKSMTMSKFAELCNLSFTSLIKYRKQEKSFEEIYELGQRPLAQKLNGVPVIAGGVEYSSLLDFNQRALQINHSTLHKWVKEFEFSPDDCLRLVKNAKAMCEATGRTMRSCLSKVSINFRSGAQQGSQLEKE